MLLKLTIIFICALVVFCESASIFENFEKCDIEDVPCGKRLAVKVLKSIAPTGVSEINVPPIDPLKFSGTTAPVAGIFNVNIKDGEATGVKNCVVDNYGGNYKEGHTQVNVTCKKITVTGKVKLEDVSPSIQKLLRTNKISGEGDIKAIGTDIKMTMDVYYDFIKKDGDIYFNSDMNKFRYNVKMNDVNFEVRNVFIGKEDASNEITKLLNENSALVTKLSGPFVYEYVFSIAKPIIKNLFLGLPTKYFLTNDFSPYVKN